MNYLSITLISYLVFNNSFIFYYLLRKDIRTFIKGESKDYNKLQLFLIALYCFLFLLPTFLLLKDWANKEVDKIEGPFNKELEDIF